ncbi:MAG TPA: zinc ribbon domain-containing protein [Pyrinomonadaceae bacterium]|jgi:hypothetical protein
MHCQNCGQEIRAGSRFCHKCGAIAAEAERESAPQPYQPYQPPASFGDVPRAPLASAPAAPAFTPARKRFGCGKVLLILCIIALLIVGGVGAAVYYGYRRVESKLKSSEAYGVALKALKENADVAAKMGQIRETGFPIGSYKEDADGTGGAIFRMSVEGTKANGTYNAVMKRENRKWRLMVGNVVLNGGETINLVSPADADEENDNDSDNDNGNLNINLNKNERPQGPPPIPTSPRRRNR